MPRAPIYGKGGRQPLSYTSYDIADEASSRMLRRPQGRRTSPPGTMGSGAGTTVMPGRSAQPMGSGFGGAGGVRQFVGDLGRSGWQSGQPLPGGTRLPGGRLAPQPGLAPYGTPEDPFRGAQNYKGPIQDIINWGGQEGVLRPDYLVNQLRRKALSNSDASRARTATLAQLSGLDPMQYRGALVDADIAANQGMVGDLNDAELLGSQQYRQMILDLLRQERGYGEADYVRERGVQADEAAQGGLGGFLGSALGTGLGAFTGGLGSGLGRRMLGP